jgi:hypothetical protein
MIMFLWWPATVDLLVPQPLQPQCAIEAAENARQLEAE